MEGLPNDLWSDPVLESKYRFERQLASSVMATVVTARHLELDERVAIKFLSPEAQRSTAAVTRFRREARAAAKIKNHHVVRIIDVATTETGIPYIVMEYLDGQDLERLLASYTGRRAPLMDAVDFILQASEAVIEGHALGIVHRDLKPANLFCVDRGDGYPMIKVLDFGISKFTTAAGDTERTDKHEILGSPRYMSPEQITSAWSVDQRSDIWSLGVILYEAIAGVAPFKDDIVPELWRKIRSDEPVRLTELRPDCPEDLAAVVHKCLAKDPERRYGDLSELARALGTFAPERSRGAIDRIRWTVDSSNDVSTRPSTYSDSYDRPLTKRTRRPQEWRRLGTIGSAVALVVGLGLAGLIRAHASSSAMAAEGTSPLPAAAAPQPSLPPTSLPAPAQSIAESARAPDLVPTTNLSPSRRANSPAARAPATSSAPALPVRTTTPLVRHAPTTNATDPTPPWLVPPVDTRK